MLFAILAVGAQLDRNYIREKTLEGQQSAAAKGRHGRRGPGSSTTTCSPSRALRATDPEIAKKLTIKTGSALRLVLVVEMPDRRNRQVPKTFVAYRRSACGSCDQTLCEPDHSPCLSQCPAPARPDP
ncbi:hypothetical protein [Nonomuraea africana]|uniref:hypothetical protein n=1 Tax=Nonomuraea africana TaxID=46171 RepID=UPI0033EDB40F